MTEVLTTTEVNCETGEVTERPLTAEEVLQREEEIARFAAEKAARVAAEEALAALKASAKAKLISGQPLTAEEADTLVI